MDTSTTITIASATVSLLVPYLKSMGDALVKKMGEEIGQGAGSTAWSKAKELYEFIKARVSTKSSAMEALDDLAESPDDGDRQAAVRSQLKKIMLLDEPFARQLATFLKEAADAGADTVFHTTIYGDVQKLVQMGNVYGDVTI